MIRAVVFDVGRVLVQWDLRHLFAKLIDDPEELEWFVTHVVTPEWHFQHDAGRPLAEMLPELKAEYPAYTAHI
ncbi:MAG: HAD family phosphatase, partial [Sphingomonadales bacterium]